MDTQERASTIMHRARQVATRQGLGTRTRMFSYNAPALAIYGERDDYLGTVELDPSTGMPKSLAERWVTKSDRRMLEQYRAALIKSLEENPIS